MRRRRRADGHENRRNRPADVNGRGRIADITAEETDHVVAEFGQGLRGVARELLIRKKLYQSWN